MNRVVNVGEFDQANHFYERVLNAHMHPMVSYFFSLNQTQIINRYCHLHPATNKDALSNLLSKDICKLRWAGADLFNVTTEDGKRSIVVIETNTCPSGQKSMPPTDEHNDYGGYEVHVRSVVEPNVPSRAEIDGCLCVLFDKNPMEATGYAATMADVLEEEVFLVEAHVGADWQPFRFDADGLMEIYSDPASDGTVLHAETETGQWIPVRFCMRYVTQKPWMMIPLVTRTKVLNPISTCLAGGRNKLVAAKAYELFNTSLREDGLAINAPKTICDVSQAEIPLYVELLGGRAVVKVPYSNAGQGVFTITTPEELQDFMDQEFIYDKFIVQALIGTKDSSSVTDDEVFFHTGTIPSKKGQSYCADLRMMVCNRAGKGFVPVAMYARKARVPLANVSSENSWNVLGTNLSVKNEDGSWSTETNRLMLMDRKDFNKLGLGVDDLITAFVQTVLAVTAIDEMAERLVGEDGSFNYELFSALNNDDALIAEIEAGNSASNAGSPSGSTPTTSATS